MQDEAKEKALAAFVDEIRLRSAIPHRMAIVDDDRKEFFRGKDLQRYCVEQPTKMQGLVNPSAAHSPGFASHSEGHNVCQAL